MSELQKRFNGLLKLLQSASGLDSLVVECINATEGEISFTAPKHNAAYPTATTVAEIMRLTNSNGSGGDSTFLRNALAGSVHVHVALWYIISEQGSYTIATDPNEREVIGIAKSPKTLTQVRKDYFIQKEALEKFGEKPLTDYGDNENTFVNRKLVE